MTALRKISLPFVLFALMMLVAHSVVPHHHTDEADLMCVSPSAHHNHNSHATQTSLSANTCSEDTICGLSHSYLSNHAENEIIAPFCEIIESLVHAPHCRHCLALYVISDAPLIELSQVGSVPRRAPPVMC